jgi:ABC-type glycerol-3-phosphate transport system substrate-binding protein
MTGDGSDRVRAGKKAGITRRDLLRLGATGALAAGGAGILAACGSPASAPSSRSSSNAKVTLTLWSWYTDQTTEWPRRIAEYQSQHRNVTIENRIFGNLGEYLPALEAAVSAGQPPDIFGPANLAITYARGGILLDLTQALGKSYLDQFFASANAEYTYQNRQYAVGWEAQAFGLFYNPSLLQKAGVDVPQTWDDLLASVDPIKSKAGVAPLILHAFPSNGASDFLMPLITQVTNNPRYAIDLDQQTNGRRWTDAPVVTALQLIERLAKAGAIVSGSLSAQVADAERLFYQGKGAMLYLHSSVPYDLIAGAPPSFVQQYRVAKSPAWKSGARHWTGNQAGSGLAISAHSKYTDAALEFLKFLYEPAGYAANMTASNALPATKAAATMIKNPVTKEMASWLLEGDGCPHILFGSNASAVGNAVEAVMNGSATAAQAASQMQAAVHQTG